MGYTMPDITDRSQTVTIKPSDGIEAKSQSDHNLEPHNRVHQIDDNTNNGESVKNTQQMSVMKLVRTDVEYRHKFIHTIILCWSFIAYGWVAGMTGPTFPDIRQIIQEDLATSTWTFTVGAFGFMIGSLGGGYLFDKINKEALLAASFLGAAVSQFATPYCTLLSTMLVARFCVGIFCGVIDTGGNADIYYVWGKGGGSYMQALHFGFSIGALLAPLASEPFLAKKINICTNTSLAENATTPFFTSTPLRTGYTEHSEPNITEAMLDNSCEEQYEDTNVHHAFLLSAVLLLSAAVGFIYLICKPGNAYAKADTNTADDDKQTEDNKTIRRKKLSMKEKIFFLVMICFQIASYGVIEDTFAGFLMTFCLSHLKWNKSEGSFATAAFWISFAIGRFLGIFITRCCKPTFMLTVYLILMAVGLVGFFLGVFFRYIPVVWIFIIVLGFAMSIIFPAFFSWTSENVIPIKGKVSSVIFTFLILIGMAFPVIMGSSMEYLGPMWYVYILLIAMTYCLLHFVVLRILVKVIIQVKTIKNDETPKETEMSLVNS